MRYRETMPSPRGHVTTLPPALVNPRRQNLVIEHASRPGGSVPATVCGLA
jgi:hypothetical protein